MEALKILLDDHHKIILNDPKTVHSNEKYFIFCGPDLAGIEALKKSLIHYSKVMINGIISPNEWS
jgi:hypothetical protein